jgi:protein O-mannosyl-transferase
MIPNRHARWLAAGTLLALVLIVYVPVIRTGGFIWDDPQYITGNPLLRTARGLLAIWIHPSASPQYYPLVHTTFWLEYHIAGLQPGLYHIDNILLHALGVILLWRALVRLNVPGAWLAAAIFAVHPIEVESVAWATERKNVLSLVFYLLAFHAYLSFQDHYKGKYYVVALLCIVAALLSKSVTCSLPAAILLIVYWKNGRLRWTDVVPLIPFFVVGLAMAMATAAIEKNHVGASGPEWAFSSIDRCLIAGRALWFYAVKLAFPNPLVFIYPRWEEMNVSHRPWLIAFPLAAIGVMAALWRLRRRIGRGPVVVALFFAGTLVPALGFINLYPMRYSFVADHFQYQAGIGLIVLAAAGLRKLPAAFNVVILIILGALTWHQGAIYRNQLVLWSDTVNHNPTSWMAWGNLGDEYADLSNRTDLSDAERANYRSQARQCYVKLYHLAPDQPLAHLKWGIVKEYDGDLESAKAEFQKALDLAPQFTIAMNSMGMLLVRMNQPEQAMTYYREAIALDPTYAGVRVHYGDALLAEGDEDGAFEQYLQAADARPDPIAYWRRIRRRYLLMNVRVAQAVPSARPQIVVPGMMPWVFSSSISISRSLARPPPSRMRSRILCIQAEPSRQGVHWPQDSWA